MTSTWELSLSDDEQLDRKLERLIGKMIEGKASEADRMAYMELAARRAKRLHTPVPSTIARFRQQRARKRA